MSEPIEIIREELAKLDSALHRKPLTAARVGEHRRRIDRMREQLVRLDEMIRQTCLHDGAVTNNGVCSGCNQDGLSASKYP